jgi:hypothetical protein
MPTFQRGSASLGIALSISATLGSIVFVLMLASPLTAYRDAIAIKSTLSLIETQANLSYRKKVMLSRCVTDNAPMTIQRLINEKRIPTDVNSGLHTFETRFTSININGWTRPNYLEIRVTFADSAALEAIASHLNPTIYQPLTLVFLTPIQIDVTDNLSHFDKKTGCLQ